MRIGALIYIGYGRGQSLISYCIWSNIEFDLAGFMRPGHVGRSGILISHSSRAFLNFGKDGSSSAGVGWRRPWGMALNSLQQRARMDLSLSHWGRFRFCW